MYLTNVKEKMGKWFKMDRVLKGNQADFVRLKAQKLLS